MLWKMKNWLLRLTEPWREEQASLDLEWEVFAKKHNAAGHRPEAWTSGSMELDPMEKVHFVDAHEVSPNFLRDQHVKYVDRDSTAVEREQNLRFSNRKGLTEKDDARL